MATTTMTTKTTTNEYLTLKERQQKEVNEFPLGFAFSEEQFNKMMSGWGLDASKPEDIAKIASIGISGGYIQKKDVQAFISMNTRHEQERKAAIEADKTGDGYIYSMFLYELTNHEFGYTYDADDTLEALGITREEIAADPRLAHGFEKAKTDIIAADEF